ncbi:hypothetical protein [Marinococcus halotolerans]|uniref:hypothetical protein n=1 Tax=Marinococcus halotolerans TaxID=301092 RepID=UPI0003B75604|nr:hypothetical protein [Marinococcus halotolerans]
MYVSLRKRRRKQRGRGYFRHLSLADKRHLQKEPWFFDWETMLNPASPFEVHGLFAANHHLLALMAVDFSPGVATVEYVERAGYKTDRPVAYHILPHLIGYACELNFRVFGDYILVIIPKTTPIMVDMYNQILNTTLAYIPQQAIDLGYTYSWAVQWHGDERRDAIYVQGYCAKAMRDLYYKKEGS